MATDIAMEPPRGGADVDAYADVARHAFAVAEDDLAAWLAHAGHGRIRVAQRAGQVVGWLILVPMGQWFGGRARVEPGGTGADRLDIRGLAAVYSGFVSPAQAAARGLASGDPRAMDLLGAAFAGPQPWMRDQF